MIDRPAVRARPAPCPMMPRPTALPLTSRRAATAPRPTVPHRTRAYAACGTRGDSGQNRTSAAASPQGPRARRQRRSRPP